jgi:lysophospholipase L1-like esterase
MRAVLALAATGVLAVAMLALWLRHDYRQEKLATLEPPFRSGLVGIEGAGTPARVVFFGDSRVAQWDLAGFERFGPVLNAGFGGDTLAGMADRLDRDVLASAPEIVVFLGGINDLTAQSMLDESARRAAYQASLGALEDILARLRARGIRTLLLSVGPPLDVDLRRRFVWGSGIEEAVADLNAHIQRLEAPDVHVVDTLEVFAASGAGWETRVRKDPLHYTPEAYALLTRAVADALEEVR